MLPESSSWRMERLQQVGLLDVLLALSNATGASKIYPLNVEVQEPVMLLKITSNHFCPVPDTVVL